MYAVIDLEKGGGVERGVRVERQPSDYFRRVYADVDFGGEYRASSYSIRIRTLIVISKLKTVENFFPLFFLICFYSQLKKLQPPTTKIMNSFRF
jgi:hypothetical protein